MHAQWSQEYSPPQCVLSQSITKLCNLKTVLSRRSTVGSRSSMSPVTGCFIESVLSKTQRWQKTPMKEKKFLPGCPPWDTQTAVLASVFLASMFLLEFAFYCSQRRTTAISFLSSLACFSVSLLVTFILTADLNIAVNTANQAVSLLFLWWTDLIFCLWSSSRQPFTLNYGFHALHQQHCFHQNSGNFSTFPTWAG